MQTTRIVKILGSKFGDTPAIGQISETSGEMEKCEKSNGGEDHEMPCHQIL